MVVIGYAHDSKFHHLNINPLEQKTGTQNMQNNKDNIFATQIKRLNYFK